MRTFAVVVAIALASCNRGTAHPASAAMQNTPQDPARCYHDGVAPPMRVSRDHALLDGIDPHEHAAKGCPLDRPADGSPCKVAVSTATDSDGHPSEAYNSCFYVQPGESCDPTECECQRSAPGQPLTFECTDDTIIE